MSGTETKAAIHDQALALGFDTVGFADPDLGEAVASGASVANQVAAIEVPAIHHVKERPATKYSRASWTPSSSTPGIDSTGTFHAPTATRIALNP